MTQYKLDKNFANGQEPISVIKLDKNIIIPFDPDNRHYQDYQEWLAQGNIPLPPEE